jgi:predicted transcriptional regulator
MMLLSEMKRLLEEQAPGPHPSFTTAHVLYSLFLIDDTHIGRQKLAADLSMGEGSVRTLLKRLTLRGLIKADRTGCYLTSKGRALYDEVRRSFYLFKPRDEGFLGGTSFGVGVRGGGPFANGIAERDEAVRAGAAGAMTLVYKDHELMMPGLSNLSREYPDLAESVLKVVTPKTGDAIVISWGREAGSVVYGSLSAAWALYERLSTKS